MRIGRENGMAEKQIYTVSEMNRLVKGLVEGSGDVANIQVRGEISNFKRYPSGHCYFSLKDNSAVLKCVMFRHQAMRLVKFPENGDTVVAIGSIRVYERDGIYQLYVDLMKAEGIGSLMQAYEKLKNKLAGEGLFAEENKKQLPVYPRRVGIITSPAGAAVRDIITVSRRRDPGVQLFLFPVAVQGKAAAGEIVRAIRFMNRHHLAEVLIVGRGGGSLEDLWAFNEEAVVRAIAASDIPVVSSVGHETDFTLSDFAADKRAATPSQAAEIAVADVKHYLRQVEGEQEKLITYMQHILREKTQAWQRAADNPMMSRPLQIFEKPEERLDRAIMRLANTLPVRLQNRELRLQQAVRILQYPERLLTEPDRRLKAAVKVLRHPEKYLEKPEQQYMILEKALKNQKRFYEYYDKKFSGLAKDMRRGIQNLTERKSRELALLTARMDAVSPLKVLGRGYSMTMDENGKLLKSVNAVHWGEEIRTRLNDGEIYSVIQQIDPAERKAE